MDRFIQAYRLVLPLVFLFSMGGLAGGVLVTAAQIYESNLNTGPAAIINVCTIIKLVIMQSWVIISPLVFCYLGKLIINYFFNRRCF